MFKKDFVSDAIVNEMYEAIYVFYKENNQWFFYDRKEDQEYVLVNVKEMFTLHNENVVQYETDTEKGLFLIKEKSKIILPEELGDFQIIDVSRKDQTMTVITKEYGVEKIVEFTWKQ